MKKILLSCFVCTLVFLDGYTQNDIGKTYISVSLGPSFPVGSYGSKDFYSTSSGLAKTGESIDISFTSLIKKHIGFAATLLAQRNAVDVKSLEDGFSQAKYYNGVYGFTNTGAPVTPPSNPSYATYPNWRFAKKSWLSAGLMAGAYCQFPLQATGKISFTGKIMAGAIYAASPHLTGSSTTDTAFASAEQTSAKAFGFSFLLSGGLQYKLTKKIDLLGSLQYAGTNNIAFHKVTSNLYTLHYTNGGLLNGATTSTSQSVTADYKQNMNTLNLVFGFALKL